MPPTRPDRTAQASAAPHRHFRPVPPLPAPPTMALADDLDAGVIHTEISPRLARAMTVGFLALIFAVPLAQVGLDLLNRRPVQAFKVFTRTPTRANLDAYEHELGKQSFAPRAVQPRLQAALTGGLGFGTKDVVVGRDGWLFYRPGIEALAGPGLLDPARLGSRGKALAEAGEGRANPDPRPAILAFDRDCRRAGVRLVVVPVPDKAAVQAGELTRRLAVRAPEAVPANADHGRLVADLRAGGVDVFDPTPARLQPGDPPRFLRRDTHWTPAWMESVAAGLADHLRAEVPSLRAPTRSFEAGEEAVARVGDLVDMLRLPADQALYPPQGVTIHPVRDARTGAAWSPVDEADVVVLGDSFCNIYNSASLGWGLGAGFPAQLARRLGRDVDVIARNGSGASTTRRELARRPDPLAGKRVVVWQFAARDLALASWDIIPLPTSGDPASTRRPPESEAGPLVVEGTVVAASRVPQPFEVPYKDCLTYVKVRVDRLAEGATDDDHVIAVFWGMKDNRRLPAAGYEPGRKLRLRLVPLRKAPLDLQTVRSVDDLDDYDRRPYYVLDDDAPIGPLAEAPSTSTSARHPSTPLDGTPKPAPAPAPMPARSAEVATARAAAVRAAIAEIRAECARNAGGDWDRWSAMLEPYRAELRQKVLAAQPFNPDASGGVEARSSVLEGRDGFPLFESAPLTYLPYMFDPSALRPFRAQRPVVAAARWLQAQGIDLIFVPVPKMMEVYPDAFIDRTPPDRVVCPDLRRGLVEMLEADVEVVNLLPSLLAARNEAPTDYLYQPADPHWSPRAQMIAARIIADRLGRYDFVRGATARPPLTDMVEIAYPPIARAMSYLALSPDQLRRAESAHPRTVRVARDPSVQQSPDAPIAFVGDSYNGGLLEFVASEVNMPVRNFTSGGQTTHAFKDFVREPELLKGCRVVVWLVCDSSLQYPWPLPPRIAGEVDAPPRGR